MSKTYLDRETKKWLDVKPTSYWSGLVDYETGEYIFTGEKFLVLNASGHSKPVLLTCTDYIATRANTWYYVKVLKIKHEKH